MKHRVNAFKRMHLRMHTEFRGGCQCDFQCTKYEQIDRDPNHTPDSVPNLNHNPTVTYYTVLGLPTSPTRDSDSDHWSLTTPAAGSGSLGQRQRLRGRVRELREDARRKGHGRPRPLVTTGSSTPLHSALA